MSDKLSLLTIVSVVIDLLAQGWRIASTEPSVVLDSPEGLAPYSEKERIRRAHRIERDSQINEPLVVEFVRSMEK